MIGMNRLSASIMALTIASGFAAGKTKKPSSDAVFEEAKKAMAAINANHFQAFAK
jgi:hypothetical protein